MCMFCRSLFVLLYFFFWPFCCLFFLDIFWLSLWYLQTLVFLFSILLFNFSLILQSLKLLWLVQKCYSIYKTLHGKLWIEKQERLLCSGRGRDPIKTGPRFQLSEGRVGILQRQDLDFSYQRGEGRDPIKTGPR